MSFCSETTRALTIPSKTQRTLARDITRSQPGAHSAFLDRQRRRLAGPARRPVSGLPPFELHRKAFGRQTASCRPRRRGGRATAAVRRDASRKCARKAHRNGQVPIQTSRHGVRMRHRSPRHAAESGNRPIADAASHRNGACPGNARSDFRHPGVGCPLVRTVAPTRFPGEDRSCRSNEAGPRVDALLASPPADELDELPPKRSPLFAGRRGSGNAQKIARRLVGEPAGLALQAPRGEFAPVFVSFHGWIPFDGRPVSSFKNSASISSSRRRLSASTKPS